MKKLLILGTSFASMEIIEKARRRGWHVIVTDNQPLEKAPVKQAADASWMISTAEIDLLEATCREEGVDAVFAGVSEFNLDRVHELAQVLGLPCYIDAGAWEYARNKRLFKDKCVEMGIPVVPEYPVPAPDDEAAWERISYPVVVKPVDGTGNKGLSICRDREELEEGLRKARESSAHQKLIIERYVTGVETWNYYFFAQGQIRYVYSGTAFKQPDRPTYLYSFATTAAGRIDEYLQEMHPKCIELLREIGCKEGMAWIQCIQDDEGNYYALEMAHRMSAETTGDVLVQCLGFNSVDWMLDTALGVTHSAAMLPQRIQRPYVGAECVYFLFADHAGSIERIAGLDELGYDRCRFYVEATSKLGDLVDQYRLIAKITFFASSASEMCQALQYLNQAIDIRDSEGKDLLVRFTDYDEVERRHRGLMRKW